MWCRCRGTWDQPKATASLSWSKLLSPWVCACARRLREGKGREVRRGGDGRSGSHSILPGGSALTLGVLLCLIFFLFDHLSIPCPYSGPLPPTSINWYSLQAVLQKKSQVLVCSEAQVTQNSRLLLGERCWRWKWEGAEGLANFWKGPGVHSFGFAGHMVSVATANPPAGQSVLSPAVWDTIVS